LINSTLGEFNFEELFVLVNPEDAEIRQLRDGGVVRVFNERGEVRAPARIHPQVRPGVVVMPKGAWRKASRNGWTATALAPDTISSVGGGACFNDARVEIAPAD
jgi:anaerobic selenocysteine-containing dehydrogenase